jgi:hypothetical protein
MQTTQIIWKILSIVGWVYLAWQVLELIRTATKYLNAKVYDVSHKTVCAKCFQGLKDTQTMLEHAKKDERQTILEAYRLNTGIENDVFTKSLEQDL